MAMLCQLEGKISPVPIFPSLKEHVAISKYNARKPYSTHLSLRIYSHAEGEQTGEELLPVTNQKGLKNKDGIIDC